MKTQTHKTEHDVVRNLRKIRDEISNEIKDMTFEQERAYLDKLLADKEKSAPNKSIAARGWTLKHKLSATISIGSGLTLLI